MVMKAVALLVSLAVSLTGVLAAPADQERARTTAPAAASPWFGTWEQDLPASVRWYESPPYKRVTLRIEPWKDGLRVVYDMVQTRGGIAHMEWEGRFDGQDYPVQGLDYPMTNAYRPVDQRSYQIVVKVDGRTAATATAVVSSDGATLTVTTTEPGPSKQGVTSTVVYRRARE
jgi:hypothetical protein